ncbi:MULTISPECIES: rhodanese-like domain-containing protein [unclassified Lentimicrobium]|uniref:rhodanese-like domain-containing protein n=1 Tax=unclassified Lentimicrobium TaxID=2677434 RepID=UPI001558249A|nr:MULTISPECIES: rhodanese-like domain-containing protein [unclassified Lentimicrobium]NPD46087.1 hypothetical protein [Lentimicrobium sp. S6]NPD84991.1 hypothetical protein [Lentimicrobium sp. L6]
MKELKRTKRLSVSIIGYLAIILIGLMSLNTPGIYFNVCEGHVMDELAEMSNEVFPDEALDYIENNEPGYLFIDVRDEYKYLQSHLDDAINIPMNQLLEDDNIEVFQKAQQDSLIVVFYGDSQIQANGAWMLMYQLGYTNAKTMLGGYDLVASPDFDPDLMEAYLLEEAQYDFYMIMEEARDQVENPMILEDKPTMQIVPVQRVENEIDEGGC